MPRDRVRGGGLGTGLWEALHLTGKKKAGTRKANQERVAREMWGKPGPCCNIDTKYWYCFNKGSSKQSLVSYSQFLLPLPEKDGPQDTVRELTLLVTSGTGHALPHSVAQAASTKC